MGGDVKPSRDIYTPELLAFYLCEEILRTKLMDFGMKYHRCFFKIAFRSNTWTYRKRTAHDPISVAGRGYYALKNGISTSTRVPCGRSV